LRQNYYLLLSDHQGGISMSRVGARLQST